MTKNSTVAKDLLAQLGRAAAADVPPVVAKMNEVPPPPPPIEPVAPESSRSPRPARTLAAPKAARRPAASSEAGRLTGVNLSGPAVAALKRLQAFMLTECGGSNASVSVAVCIALEHAAAGLPGNKAELTDLYEASRQADKRRRPT